MEKRATPLSHWNKKTANGVEKAAQHLLYGIHILPERIYPYYLLTLLYADTAFFQPEKMRMAADSVLLKVPKVETTATREMRDEVRKLLSKPNPVNE